MNSRITLAAGHFAFLLYACAAHEQQTAPTLVIPARGLDSATAPPARAAAAAPTPNAEQPVSSTSEVAAPRVADEAPGGPSADEVIAASEVKQHEKQKQRAIALVHQLPEVKAYCREPKGCAIVEDMPARDCKVSDADKRACAWVIAIAHVEPSGPHLSYFARFYVRNSGQLFVEPIQTGDVATLREWRCLQKHGYDTDVCASSR